MSITSYRCRARRWSSCTSSTLDRPRPASVPELTHRRTTDERQRVDEAIIEAQLAHAVKDSLGRAYNRTQFLEQRRGMLQTWATTWTTPTRLAAVTRDVLLRHSASHQACTT